MDDHLGLAVRLLQRLGMATLVVMAHSEIVRRLGDDPRRQALGTGVLLGVGAIVAMLNPITIFPGIIVDSRSVLLGLAGPFGGWPGAACAALIAGAYRAWLGGPGLAAGLLGIAAAILFGLAFHKFTKRSPEHLRFRSLVALGLGVSLSAISANALQAQVDWPAFASTAALIAACTTTGLVIVGTMLVRERRRVLAEAALREGALVDPLTGLANRRAFHASLSRAIAGADRGNGRLALLSLDVDCFKSLNDKHGHEAGDAALVSLSDALRGTLRKEDLPARLGGDEFCVVLPSASDEGALHLAERVRAAIEAAEVDVRGHRVSFSISIGVASYVKGMPAEHLLKAADEALYRAKRGGRNQVATAPMRLQAA